MNGRTDGCPHLTVVSNSLVEFRSSERLSAEFGCLSGTLSHG